MAKGKAPPVAASGPRRVSPMWIVPLVAAILAGALYIDYRRKSGPLITIAFQEGTGLRV